MQNIPDFESTTAQDVPTQFQQMVGRRGLRLHGSDQVVAQILMEEFIWRRIDRVISTKQAARPDTSADLWSPPGSSEGFAFPHTCGDAAARTTHVARAMLADPAAMWVSPLALERAASLIQRASSGELPFPGLTFSVDAAGLDIRWERAPGGRWQFQSLAFDSAGALVLQGIENGVLLHQGRLASPGQILSGLGALVRCLPRRLSYLGQTLETVGNTMTLLCATRATGCVDGGCRDRVTLATLSRTVGPHAARALAAPEIPALGRVQLGTLLGDARVSVFREVIRTLAMYMGILGERRIHATTGRAALVGSGVRPHQWRLIPIRDSMRGIIAEALSLHDVKTPWRTAKVLPSDPIIGELIHGRVGRSWLTDAFEDKLPRPHRWALYNLQVERAMFDATQPGSTMTHAETSLDTEAAFIYADMFRVCAQVLRDADRASSTGIPPVDAHDTCP